MKLNLHTFSAYTMVVICAVAVLSVCVSCKHEKTVNYAESKVHSYTLPALLETSNGTKVETVEQWEQVRRPELLKLFAEQMYGTLPDVPVEAEYNVLEEKTDAFDGKATRQQIEITFRNNGLERKALLLMYLPNVKEEKVPVFLHFNFRGNHTTSNDPDIIPSQFSEYERGNQISRWPIEKIVNAGYGLATVHYYDFYPDSKERLGESILPLLGINSDADRTGVTGGAIAAWAWGYSRIMDYLETLPRVDASKVIVMGHSRLGKTSLWVGVNDPRFAIVVDNCSGCGGSALSRRDYGETIDQLNSRFPHWFCPNFSNYDYKEETLPFDQHELIALVAPRPVYIGSAEEDRWADPKGMFLATSYAGDVYHLYGLEGLDTMEMPAVNEPIHHSVGFHIRNGIHDVTDFDWDSYIAFANKWLR